MVTMLSNYLTIKQVNIILFAKFRHFLVCLSGFYDQLLMESQHFYKIETGHKLSDSGY